jgi:hypothetical protein
METNKIDENHEETISYSLKTTTNEVRHKVSTNFLPMMTCSTVSTLTFLCRFKRKPNDWPLNKHQFRQQTTI